MLPFKLSRFLASPQSVVGRDNLFRFALDFAWGFMLKITDPE